MVVNGLRRVVVATQSKKGSCESGGSRQFVREYIAPGDQTEFIIRFPAACAIQAECPDMRYFWRPAIHLADFAYRIVVGEDEFKG